MLLCSFFWFPGMRRKAKGPRLELSVDRTRVEVGDQITLTVTLTAEGDVPAPELCRLPDGFDVIGRSTYTTQELNITNGPRRNHA